MIRPLLGVAAILALLLGCLFSLWYVLVDPTLGCFEGCDHVRIYAQVGANAVAMGAGLVAVGVGLRRPWWGAGLGLAAAVLVVVGAVAGGFGSDADFALPYALGAVLLAARGHGPGAFKNA